MVRNELYEFLLKLEVAMNTPLVGPISFMAVKVVWELTMVPAYVIEAKMP